MIYIMYEKVDYIEEKFSRQLVSGHGKDAKFKDASIGWYLRIEGSNESFFLSETQPDLAAGNKLKITIQRVNEKE